MEDSGSEVLVEAVAADYEGSEEGPGGSPMNTTLTK